MTAKPDQLTLTGYEVANNGCGKPVNYRQSWVLRPVTDAQLQSRADYEERERQRMTAFMREHSTGNSVPSAVLMPPCKTGGVSHLI